MIVMLRGPADADHYRTRVGRYGDRWYVDPLPADDLATATDEAWPSVSAIKGADKTDWTFVGLKRVAKVLEANPDELDGLPYDKRYDRLLSINKLGLRRAMDRGTQVHAYFERALRGEPLRRADDNADGQQYAEAVEAFMADHQPELLAAELVCINRNLNGVGYGGTADAIVRIGGKVYLPDWKSRDIASSHGAYGGEKAQLGGYADAEYYIVGGPRRIRLPVIDAGLIVSIKPDGYRCYPIDLDEARAYWRSLHGWWVAKQGERDGIGRPWAPVAQEVTV